MTTLREAIQSSPTLFPIAFDRTSDSVHLIRMTETLYRQASFLDSRMLQSSAATAAVPWPELRDAAEGLSVRCDYIFHISHAGSTLVSRILGQHPNCFALREPAVLRQLVDDSQAVKRFPLLSILSRTFHAKQRALIKATSYVSQIGVWLMRLSSESRAILMYIPPQSFLAALLDGAMSDIESHAQSRLDRLQLQGLASGLQLSELSAGERVAMSWLCEYQSLVAIGREFPNRTLWLDFEEFLLNPSQELQRVLHFLMLKGESKPLLETGVMAQYAKQTQVRYDQQFRMKLIQASMEKFGNEIERGLAWLAIHAPTQYNPIQLTKHEL